MSRKHFKRICCKEYEKKTGLNGYAYDFQYDAITVDDILDIYKYLMEKNGIV